MTTLSLFKLVILVLVLLRNVEIVRSLVRDDPSPRRRRPLHRRQLQTANNGSTTDLLTSIVADCLFNNIPGDDIEIVLPQDESYSDAIRCHNSGRSDRAWMPSAVVKVTSSQQVASAVQCASMADMSITPRSGAHGFENEACSGELIIDVSNLDSLVVVDTTDNTNIVEFGAGHLHGQLYRKLIDFGLVVPGGTENSVGTAGLWLGCGRGLLTQVYGLSCDNMLGVEFVDARGNIRVANSTTDTDMFWMARGSGGEFPGIVTKFIARAYEMPSEVFTVTTYFGSHQVKELVRAWVARIDELSEPSNSMFAFVRVYQGDPMLSMSCYSCTQEQKDFVMAQFQDIINLAGGSGAIDEWTGTWLDRLLVEPWDDYETEGDLTQQSEWPEVWEIMANGGHMVHTTDASDEMLNAIQNVIESHRDTFTLYLYSMTGTHISTVPSTAMAYGGREAKYVVHYKVVGNTTTDVKFPLRDFSLALDQAGLPCRGFYNYADREFPCAAGSGDLWLEAHFSNVPRMKAIKQEEDPDDRFMSTLKAKMWRADVNQYTFVGWPEVGDFGGTCACPNGQVYQVGDNNDGCQSLACVGGIPGPCSENNPGGAGYRVVCDVTAPSNNPIAALTFQPSQEPTLTSDLVETQAPTMQTSPSPLSLPPEPSPTASTSSQETATPSFDPVSPTPSTVWAVTPVPSVPETPMPQPVTSVPSNSEDAIQTPDPSFPPTLLTPPTLDSPITPIPSFETDALSSTTSNAADRMSLPLSLKVKCTVLVALTAWAA